MKNILFGLIATVLFSFTGNAQTSNFISSSKYGDYHNEFLKVAREKFVVTENSTVQELCAFIINEFNNKFPNIMTQAETSFYMSRIDYMFGVDRKIKSLNGNIINDINNKGVTKYHSLTVQLFSKDLVKRNENFDITLSRIISLKTNKNLTATDLEEINKMETILKASNSFWNSVQTNSTNEVAGRCNPAAQRYLADVGGALGGWFGSATCSFIVEYGQSTSGGGCW